MQKKRRISLNAIRMFVTVARTGSLTAAGLELNVTSGAVSHQLKKLEDELGVSFFRRGNNSVTLTNAGERFYQEVAPAVAVIERSVEAHYRHEAELTVQASTSLALRWLIPSLDRFRAIYPQVRVRVETVSAPALGVQPVCDVVIRYFRVGQSAEGWELLEADISRPVISPRLLEKHGESGNIPITDVPALQCAAGNWDWKLWCEKVGLPLTDLTFVHEFDTDDAALHACIAGLGIALSPPILTDRETRSGALVALPGYQPTEIGSYRYQRLSQAKVARQFCSWMASEMLKLRQNGM